MSNRKEVSDSLQKWILGESQTIYNRLFDGARQKTPVDTGRAKAGWEKTKSIQQVGQTGEIRNEVPYIGWLEFGTDRMQPNHMVKRTILEIKKDYK